MASNSGKKGKTPARKSSKAERTASQCPKEPQTHPNSTKVPTVDPVKLSDDQMVAIVKLLVRSWGFWWKTALGLLILASITYFGLSRAIYQRIDDTVSIMETNALASLSHKMEAATRSLGLQASNRLTAVDASLSNINTQANQRLARIESVLDELATNADVKIAAAYQEITNRVSKQMVERINMEFEEDRIKRTVSDVAGTQAKEILIGQVAPILVKFVEELNATKANAATNLAQVQAAANFGLLVLRAQNDEAAAFDELVKLRESGGPLYSSLAKTMVGEIAEKLSYDALMRGVTANVWMDTTNTPSNSTLADYEKRYQQIEPGLRIFLIHEVYTHDNFAKYERLQCSFGFLKIDPSLKCRQQICFSLNGFTTQKYNILGLPLHEKWWAENEPKLREEYNKEIQSKAKAAAAADEKLTKGDVPKVAK